MGQTSLHLSKYVNIPRLQRQHLTRLGYLVYVMCTRNAFLYLCKTSYSFLGIQFLFDEKYSHKYSLQNLCVSFKKSREKIFKCVPSFVNGLILSWSFLIFIDLQKWCFNLVLIKWLLLTKLMESAMKRNVHQKSLKTVYRKIQRFIYTMGTVDTSLCKMVFRPILFSFTRAGD